MLLRAQYWWHQFRARVRAHSRDQILSNFWLRWPCLSMVSGYFLEDDFIRHLNYFKMSNSIIVNSARPKWLVNVVPVATIVPVGPVCRLRNAIWGILIEIVAFSNHFCTSSLRFHISPGICIGLALALTFGITAVDSPLFHVPSYIACPSEAIGVRHDHARASVSENSFTKKADAWYWWWKGSAFSSHSLTLLRCKGPDRHRNYHRIHRIAAKTV